MVQHAVEHGPDLGGRAALELGVDAGAAALDVPIDHHARPAVADVVLGHEVRRPRAEPPRVRRARRPLPPPGTVAGGERGVDQPGDGGTQVVAVHPQPPHSPQRRFGVAGRIAVHGVDDVADAGAGGQGEQHQQQAPAQCRALDDLPGRHRGELVGEAAQVVRLLEDVQQLDGPPALGHLALEGHEVGRLGEGAENGHADPRVAGTGHDPHAAASARGQGGVEAAQGPDHPAL